MNARFVLSFILVGSVTVCVGGSRSPSIEQILSWRVATPKPEHPVEALRRRATGSGVFKVHFRTATGTVRSVEIFQSTGDKALDAAAIKTFWRWRFKAGVLPSIRSMNSQTREPFGDEDFVTKIPVTFTLASGNQVNGPFW